MSRLVRVVAVAVAVGVGAGGGAACSGHSGPPVGAVSTGAESVSAGPAGAASGGAVRVGAVQTGAESASAVPAGAASVGAASAGAVRAAAGPAGAVPAVFGVRIDDGSLAAQESTAWLGPCGLAVTVAHVLEGSRGVTVVAADGEERGATVVSVDPASDLALLRIDDLDEPGLTLADDEASPTRIVLGRDGESVPADIAGARRVEVHIDERSGAHQRAGWALTGVETAAGDSGAPLLDDTGAVVGILFARSDSTAYATRTEELTALLGRVDPPCRA